MNVTLRGENLVVALLAVFGNPEFRKCIGGPIQEGPLTKDFPYTLRRT